MPQSRKIAWLFPRSTSPAHVAMTSANDARDRRNWAEAAALYERYLAMPGKDADMSIWVQLGNVRKEAGWVNSAMAAYERALALKPDAADTHLQIGHLMKVGGQLGKAESSYAEAVRLQPDLEDAVVELRILKSTREQDSAIPSGVGQTLTVSEAGASPATQGIKGTIDEVLGNLISGWAVNRSGPGDHVDQLTITVKHGDHVVGQVKADRYRPDVGKVFSCDAYCGFSFIVPLQYRDGRQYAFSFYAGPTLVQLESSPYTFCEMPNTTWSQLADMRRTIEDISTQLWRMRRHLDRALIADRTTISDYDKWARRYQEALQDHCRKAPLFGAAPLVSIVCPVYRPRVADFHAAVRSVIGQTYQNWELILVDDAGGSAEITREIEAFCAEDARIRALPQSTNRGISVATNVAISAASGRYVALFDHDDLLVDVALEIMVEAANRTGALMLYSDEDKIDDYGRYSDPNLKSDWNYRLLLGQNYVCHFLIVETQTLKAIGLLNEGYDGAQDHELVLRLSETLPSSKIHHVAKIVYHWRKTPGSTASEIKNKSYAVDAGASAVRDHLKRRGKDAAVWPVPGAAIYQVEWRFTDEPTVSIIIPYKEHIDLTRRCLEAIRRNTHYLNYEVILVDNWSTSVEAMQFRKEAGALKGVKVVVVEEAFNFSRLNNIACGQSAATYVLFMNNDVFVEDNEWLRKLVDESLADRDVAAVGAKLVYPDRTIQHGGVILGVGGVADHAGRGQAETATDYMGRGICAQELSAVTGASMLCRHDVFDMVGGFDEKDLAVAYNDIDLCLKFRKLGYKIIYLPTVVAEHHESVSRGDDMANQNLARFIVEEGIMLDRWKAEIAHDAFYNPNFSRSGGIFKELSTVPLNQKSDA